jgi:hypothetical protein
MRRVYASSFLVLLSDLHFDFTRNEVIGDFPKEAAREFAQGFLERLRKARRQAAVAMTETEWAIMYNVCGGNALPLIRAVTNWVDGMDQEEGDARPNKTLEKGKEGDRDVVSGGTAYMHLLASLEPIMLCEHMCQARLMSVWLSAALKGIWLGRYGELRSAIRVNPAFTFAASRLCHAPYGVFDRQELDAALEEEGLRASVEDLVKENLLGVRPLSEWAGDVPPEAFPEDCDEVVTACSAVDLYCIKRLEKNGLLPEASQARKVHCSAFHGRSC